MQLVRRSRVVILTAGMLALPALGAVTLHRLSALEWLTIDWSDPLAWIAHTPPEDMAASILRHLGLVGCYWLSAASVAYTAGRLAGLSRVVATLRPVTPPMLRSMADRLVIGAVALSSLGISPAPAMADHHRPTIVEPIELRASSGGVSTEAPDTVASVRDDYLPYDPRAPIRTDTRHESSETPAETTGAIASVRDDYLPHGLRSRAVETRRLDTVEVQRGDSLWLIASRHLTRGLGRPPTQDELRAHWQATIETNLPNLRSGDPDLIHPGEIITLPTRDG